MIFKFPMSVEVFESDATFVKVRCASSGIYANCTGSDSGGRGGAGGEVERGLTGEFGVWGDSN